MKHDSKQTITGTFRHPIYSPKGEIEGCLMQVDGSPAQLTIGREDEQMPTLIGGLRPGQLIEAQVRPAPPSKKGEGVHAVFELHRLVSADGHPPMIAGPEVSGYRGRVQRFNYARHGAINGVVLDSGDFLHLKPEGYANNLLAVGDKVVADGDAQRLVDDSGWAVEVDTLNGHAVGGRR